MLSYLTKNSKNYCITALDGTNSYNEFEYNFQWCDEQDEAQITFIKQEKYWLGKNGDYTINCSMKLIEHEEYTLIEIVFPNELLGIQLTLISEELINNMMKEKLDAEKLGSAKDLMFE